jgi:hypothetical protein
LRRLEVPSVITRTFQLYRVEFTFTPRSTGHLEVSEGDTVRLEQNFDNGWVRRPQLPLHPHSSKANLLLTLYRPSAH